MYTITSNYETLKVTQTLDEALFVAKHQSESVEIYDYKSNRLLYEWSPITGLRSFLVD